jgi:hypothetical protein
VTVLLPQQLESGPIAPDATRAMEERQWQLEWQHTIRERGFQAQCIILP